MATLLFFLACSFFLNSCFAALNVTRINKGDLYVYGDGAYIGMFLVTPKGVIVVDAPPSSNSNGNSVLDSVRNVTDKPIKWVIYSHHHLDHVGSASLYPKDAEYICHKQAAKNIEQVGLPPCTLKVNNDGYDLKIDSEHLIQLRYHKPIHTPGNLYIYVPHYKLLMLVDFVFPQWGPYHSLGMASTLTVYNQSFADVLSYEFDYYVGGHVDRIGSRNDVLVQQQLFNDIMSSVKEGLSTVQFGEIAEEQGGFNGKNTFSIYGAYSEAVAEYCADKVLNKLGWSKKLIDAAAFMQTHCFLVYEAVTVNY
eukprot:TRINITY_DN1676_c0_g1_i1.p1 TRINITY_DN1676_c0_g1~~TRINITY_DN1676_c0_g1_i1.p1  ORF type:complete len:324 (+),score=65.64 TRINITY_DN1676_c0_g1_i1:50-973(+)